jgi:hypothetical protein
MLSQQKKEQYSKKTDIPGFPALIGDSIHVYPNRYIHINELIKNKSRIEVTHDRVRKVSYITYKTMVCCVFTYRHLIFYNEWKNYPLNCSAMNSINNSFDNLLQLIS